MTNTLYQPRSSEKLLYDETNKIQSKNVYELSKFIMERKFGRILQIQDNTQKSFAINQQKSIIL